MDRVIKIIKALKLREIVIKIKYRSTRIYNIKNKLQQPNSSKKKINAYTFFKNSYEFQKNIFIQNLKKANM